MGKDCDIDEIEKDLLHLFILLFFNFKLYAKFYFCLPLFYVDILFI